MRVRTFGDEVLRFGVECSRCIEGIVHNVIEQKIIIRRFLNYFCKKYRRRKKYWKSFKIIKDFHLIEKKKDN